MELNLRLCDKQERVFMSFKNISLRKSYKTYKNDIVSEFYTPVLQEASLYQRAVGFFSSSALIDLTKGISGMIRNGGRIQFIVSPRLDEDDIEAINKGYEKKKIIGKALLRDFKEPENYFQEERLNWLAYLIEEGFLEIKVAFTPPNKEMGMYHEKVGIVTDSDGNRIVFTGSLNETENAFRNNYESIVVFTSWEESKAYADEMQKDFINLWEGNEADLEIIEFPDVVKERFTSYRKSELNLEIDVEEPSEYITIKKGIPHIPDGFEFRDYQIEAIEEWKRHSYHGIFDMATGTGKTYTGLGAIVKLYEERKRLAIIIVCPYQHLVEQWVEDIELFNINPIIGYSASKQKNWKKRIETDVVDFSIGIIDTFCFVTTNATYSSKFVDSIMDRLGPDTLLLVDEAHNFGSESLKKRLHPNIEYRLALSATLERHGDDEGTEALKDFFGDKCIEYTLERAIKEKKLTPYYYYPVVIYLNDEELDEYKELSYQISKECYEDKNKKTVFTEKGKMLLLKRARIVAGAAGKLDLLRDLMEKYRNETHMLIYCGATRVQQDFSDDASFTDSESERQIVAVSKILGNEFGMKVRHFTSNESAEEREIIKKRFAMADPYQAIVAIKCLDEGVNIPSIKTAFILASTTNPKEYIQRRGRVLRLADDKPFAVIYDFVTLARPLDQVDCYSPNYTTEKSLALRELSRIKEFGRIALNSREADELIDDIETAFAVSDEELEENFNVDEL